MQIQVVVSHHIRCGIELSQLVDERHQGRFLEERARVTGASLLVQSPFVADADGVGIVPLAVRTHLRQRASRPDGPIHGDVEVVADAVESPLAVPAVDILHRYTLSRQGGTAVDDEETHPTPPCEGGGLDTLHLIVSVIPKSSLTGRI